MRNVVLSFLASLFLFPSIALPMAQWDRANDPELMESNYERNFSKLPKSGKLSTPPWSDDYWPTYKGGITYRWQKKIRNEAEESKRWTYNIIEDVNKISVSINDLSPAEKYDLFLGRTDFPLTRYERERTNIMKTIPGSPEYDREFKIPTWEGLCHAWAPATLHYKNSGPIAVVGKLGHKISFGSSDLHALLTYHLHLAESPKTSFLGSRCNLDFKEWQKKYKKGEISKRELEEKMNTAECKDTNAGAFHVALVNQIGLMNQGFVVDVTRDSEVWNQPVYSFNVKVLKVINGASRGAAPGTVKEVTVKTTMSYVSEIAPTIEVVNDPFYMEHAVYTYRVELNASGEIIGGEWLSYERPDFIWKTLPAKFHGYFKELESLYKKSIQYLLPTKFSEELKSKILKQGRVSLIQREFIKDAQKAVALSKLKDEAHRIGLNHLSVEAFKEAGVREREERVASNVAALKKEMRTNFFASKFIEGTKEEVRNTHIANAIESANDKLNTNYLVSKFVKEVKGEVRDTHIDNAIGSANDKLNTKFLVSKFIKDVKGEVRDTHIANAVSDVKKELHRDFLAKTFVNGMEVEANLTKAKEAAKSMAMASIFVTEVKKDAVNSRKLKEEHKKDAKEEVLSNAKSTFLMKKFVNEVSTDAKATRAAKEAHKKNAIKALNKLSNQNFYGKRFVEEVKTSVAATKKANEAQRLVELAKLNQELITVVTAGEFEKFQELLKKGANPTFVTEEGLTPLMIAAQKEHKKILTALLKVLDQPAINAVDKQGRNALIWAITAPNQKPDRDTRAVVRELLAKNIEVNQKDSSGKTALAYVISGQFKSKLIEWALKEKGAKL